MVGLPSDYCSAAIVPAVDYPEVLKVPRAGAEHPDAAW